MDQQITLEFTLGLLRASEDPAVKEALAELDEMGEVVRQFGGADDEDVACRSIAEFALREAQKLRAVKRDLSLRHFTQRGRELLERHPSGRDLLDRMADGDQSAVAPANRLLVEIQRARAELGFT